MRAARRRGARFGNLIAALLSAVGVLSSGPDSALAARCDRIIEIRQRVSNPLTPCQYPCNCEVDLYNVSGFQQVGSWSCDDREPCGTTLSTPWDRWGGPGDPLPGQICSPTPIEEIAIMDNCNGGPLAKAKPDTCPVRGAVGVGTSKPKDSPAKLVGDPVDITTGALRQSVTDIDLGGGLAFTRLYSSDLISDSTSGLPYLGVLGSNWAHSLQWSLKRTATTGTHPGEFYVVERSFGTPAAFYKLDTAGEFSSRPGSGSLVESGSNVIFTDHDGTRAKFNGSLDLIELTLPGQLPIAVSYGSNTETYTRGTASLVLTYYASGSWAGLLESVAGGGETVTFDYAAHTYSTYSDPVLKTVVSPDRSTTSTTDTLTWTYDYATIGGRGGRLMAVKRGSQTISNWEWGSDMGGVRVLEVNEPALDQTLVLDYHEPPSSGTWTTKLFGETSSSASIAEIVSSKPTGFDDSPRMLSVTGGGGPGYEIPFSTASVKKASNDSDDMQRWHVLEDAEGRKTLFENYARDGAPGRVVEGWVDATSGGGVGVFSSNDTFARLREFTWHLRLERPLTITEPSTLGGSTPHVITYDFDDPEVAGTFVTDRVYRRIESGQTLDAAGDPVPVTYTTTYAYDSLFRLASISGPRTENKTVFGYDGDGTGGTTGFRNSVKRCLNTGCTSYLETTYANFDARGNAGTVTDPNGRVTTFTHDGLGRVRSVTPPWSGSGSSTVSFTYDADENLSKIDFPADSFGSASSLTMGYTPKRRLEYMVDAQGNALVFEYDRSRVSRAARYTGFTSMTSRGTLRGDSKRTHDVAGRLVKSFNPLYTDDTVSTHVTVRDDVGNAERILDENAKQDDFSFDSLDRLLEIAEVRGSVEHETKFLYDPQSSVTSITDPGTKETEYRNDDFGRLVEVTSPDTGVTRYLHDAAGNLVSKIEDAEGSATRTTTYAYDPLNRLLEVDLPNDPDWDFTYDIDSSKNQKGRLASVTNGVVITAFEYTDRGQVKKETTTVGGLVYSVVSTWDKSGKLETMTSPSGVVTTAKYRGLRPRELRVAAGAVDHTIEELEFLPFGPRASAKIPPRDTGTGHNRVTSTRLYNERMQPKEIEVKDSGTLVVLDRRYAYDYRGGSPGPVEKGPNLDELIDDRDGSESRFYFYDELDRLWRATNLSGTAIHTYGYDAGGNRTSEATSGGTAGFTYETGTNRLASRTTYGARYYKHDAYGNRIYDSTNAWSGTQTLYYNDENRLVEARDPSNPTTVKGTYVYDAFGRRVRKVAGTTQVFFYGPDGQMVEEVYPRRPLFTTDYARRYVHVDGELMAVVSQEVAVGTSAWTPVAWQALPPETRAPLAILLATLVSAGLLTLHPRARRAAAAVAVSGAAISLHSCTPAAAFAWVHTDILGTPLAVTDSPATGTAIKVVWRASYEPFGNATVAPNLDGDGNPANDFVLHVRFPGQYFDGESGVHYNHFRDYDPATGRYLEADPIGQAGGMNSFVYALGDPIQFIDPVGLYVEVGVRDFYPVPIPYAKHCYLRFNGNNDDTMSFTNVGVGPDANPGAGDLTRTIGSDNDDCVRVTMTECSEDDYHFTDFNCCMCAANALNKCGLENDGVWPNKPYDASDPPFVRPSLRPTMRLPVTFGGQP